MIVSTVLFMHCRWPEDMAAFFSGMPSMILISRSMSFASFRSFMMYQVAYGEKEMIATDTFSAAATLPVDANAAATVAIAATEDEINPRMLIVPLPLMK